MTWIEHPRIVGQAQERVSTLAKFQYTHNFSQEEMSQYFDLLAKAKTNGFDTIEEFQLSQAHQAKTDDQNFNNFDQVGKILRTQMVQRKK